MKSRFRYLMVCTSLSILTACHGETGNLENNAEQINESKEVETITNIAFDNYIVISNQSGLYSSPSEKSEQIDVLYKNTLIQVEVSEDGLWRKVKIDENTIAYIPSTDIKYVGIDYDKYTDYQIVDTSKKYALINVDVGNIRNLPDMNGEIVGKYKYGDSVQILGVTKNNWNVIMYKENVSYISSEIITYITKEEYDCYNFKITKSDFDESKSVLIGTYTTNYAPTNSNRGYNVELSSRNIDGFVIPPGSLFNWCRDMGECGKDEGFKESNEIVDGEYVKGYGGGICQVSSTLCAAISTSDGKFEFFERHKHSKAQKYIPRELDATVSYPNVNFIIKNCNEYPVIIKSYCDSGNITIEIYKVEE